MRARFQPPSYFELVNLQPDSPRKEKLQQYATEYADQEHAAFLYQNLLAMQQNIVDLQQRMARDRAARMDVSPSLIRLHIQASRQHERMKTALDALRETTYRNACSRLYVETGWRIGPQEWPDAAPAPAPARSPGLEAIEAAFANMTAFVREHQADKQVAPSQPVAQAAHETAGQVPTLSETAPAAAPAGVPAPQPISHKRIKPLLKTMQKAGIDPSVREQIRRDALEGRYDWGQLRQKVNELVGAA